VDKADLEPNIDFLGFFGGTTIFESILQ
jgi:hypothetical protein